MTPVRIRQCPCCGRQAPVNINVCPLTGKKAPRCLSCFDSNAVPPAVITRVVNKAGWKDLPKAIRDAIRVFDMDEYVSVPTWARRLSHRQLAPCTPEQLATDEENAEAAYLVEKMKQVAVQSPEPQPKPRRWLLTLVSWLGLAPTWELSS